MSFGRYAGIARGADIISLKILDSEGRGSLSAALSAVSWIIENKDKYNIKVMNLSIGSKDMSSNGPLIAAVSRAWEAGIAAVAAGGNAGAKGRGIWKGKKENIITVGTFEDYYDENSSFMFNSMKHRNKPDVLCPGLDVVSCMSKNYSFDFKSRSRDRIVDNYYIKMSGSSMATPVVSGAAALFFERFGPVSPDILKEKLLKTINPKTGMINVDNFLV